MATITIDTDTTWSEDKDYSGDDIIVTNGATLTINSAGKVGGAGLITIKCNNLTIDSGSQISAYAKGYKTNCNGYGPGGGKGARDPYYGGGGGGYGGSGQAGDGGIAGGGTYGSVFAPVDMGSGGGRGCDCYSEADPGYGGGAMRLLVSSRLVVNGVINANGSNGQYFKNGSAGGGSGGSIWIEAPFIEGSGVVQANGGSGGGGNHPGGDGGGGRIAVYYMAMSSPTFEATSGGGQDGTVELMLYTAFSSYYYIENSSGSTPLSFKYYKCWRWQEGVTHGGPPVVSPVPSGEIFDDISAEEREAGDVDYRKIFFINDSFAPVSGIKGYISQPTPALNDEIYICASGTKDDTVAEASGYNYVHPSSLADPDAIDWGTLQPGEYKPLWIKRVVQAAAGDGYTNNSFKIKIGKVG